MWTARLVPVALQNRGPAGCGQGVLNVSTWEKLGGKPTCCGTYRMGVLIASGTLPLATEQCGLRGLAALGAAQDATVTGGSHSCSRVR